MILRISGNLWDIEGLRMISLDLEGYEWIKRFGTNIKRSVRINVD